MRFISGGQGALARPWEIPILDKGTSALDPKNEVTILDAVQIPGARRLLLNSQVTCDADE